MTAGYGAPLPPKKTSPLVWIGLGCGVLLLAFVAFIGFIGVVAMGSMRSSDPYKDAVQRAQGDSRVTALLGEPIEAGWLVSGSISVDNDKGTATLAIPISGPKGKAKVHVQGEKQRGRWTYSQMIVTPEKGEEIDLLSGESSS